jgi:hypothetical protein
MTTLLVQKHQDILEFTKPVAKLVWSFPVDNVNGKYAYSQSEYREKLRAHVAHMCTLMGWPSKTYAEYLNG